MKISEEKLGLEEDIKIACRCLFGTAGKATVKAFKNNALTDTYKWAAEVAFGEPDAVQKILGMSTIIGFEPDAVNFLLSLPMTARLRLLQATTFKYRGQTQKITPDHVRDTGYIFKNLRNIPNLGRIRCWFSVHETLSKAFVEELPDEAIPIPAGWERLDGLCDVNGAWELEFPRRVATLKYWGSYAVFDNCAATYGPAIKQGRSIIFAVREGGVLTHCVEYAPRASGFCDCKQFYRRGNSPADPVIESSVKKAITQAMGW